MKVIVKVNAVNGKSEIVASTCEELEQITGSFDRIGTDYDLHYVTTDGGANGQ